MAVPMIGARLKSTDTRKVHALPKTANDLYSSAPYRCWREAVIARAGRRCEEVVNGVRCTKAEPRHRMFADHKIEVRDGGDLFDPANGKCMCGSHHSAKTAAARAARR